MAKKAPAGKAQVRRTRGKPVRRGVPMVFSATNYRLLLLGIALVTVGYTIMRIENEVDGIISLYVAPILILGGYLEVIYAILYRKKPSTSEGNAQS